MDDYFMLFTGTAGRALSCLRTLASIVCPKNLLCSTPKLSEPAHLKILVLYTFDLITSLTWSNHRDLVGD